MILSMIAVLLLFALINGLLVYSIIQKSDAENTNQFGDILLKNEEGFIDTWLDFANSAVRPYVKLSNRSQDSVGSYKEKALSFLRHGPYFIFDTETGKVLMYRDSLPQNENVFEIQGQNASDSNFARKIMENARRHNDSYVTFKYSKPSIAKGIYIEDWDWVIAAVSHTDKLDGAAKLFSGKFNDSRLTLMGNLLSMMLISFLIGMFLIYRQMNAFVVPLRSLLDYIHRLATEGIRFEEFRMPTKSQGELKSFARDLNAMVHNVGSLIENVRISADRVSDLSGACTDMLDIVDYDAKLVGQRTAEMAVSSKDVIENVSNMAIGIEDININLDGLKRLASHVAENTMDIKSSISQMSDAMRALNEKSSSVQNSTMLVTQAINDIEVASIEELAQVNNVNDIAAGLHGTFEEMADEVNELRRYSTLQKANSSKDSIDNICRLVDELNNRIVHTQIQLSNLRENQFLSLIQVAQERKNISKEISSEALELKNSITSMVDGIAGINSNSQYINSSIKRVASDINEAYRNVDEVFMATDNMNEHAKQVRSRMDEFSLKAKRVEEAHSAIEHTLIDAKDSMKSLNDLSANLRRVVDDLVRLDDKTQKIEAVL